MRLLTLFLLCLIGIGLTSTIALAQTTPASETAPPGATILPYEPPRLSVQIPGVSFTKAILRNGRVEVPYIAQYINGVYRFVIGTFSIVAIVMIMVGGIQYMIGSTGLQVGNALERLRNSVIGLLLLLATHIIVVTINPQLGFLTTLNLAYVPRVFVSTENTGNDVSSLSLSDPPSTGTGGVPYYSQRNYTDVYGEDCDGNTTIKTSGCGPTSAAMVLSYYGINASPRTVAASFEDEGYRVCGSGTAYEAFRSSSLIKDNNLKSTFIPIQQHDVILDHLRNAEPVIISVGKSRFTRGGHFMVLTGVNEDGTISLNDPNSGIQSVAQDELWNIIKFAAFIEPTP